MKTFTTIEAALEYTATTLIAQNHTYIINVVGPREAAENRAATIQLVAQHMIYEDRNCGLTLSLPFDPSSGEFTHLVEFMGSAISDLCDEYKWDGIPCFALRFGTNVEVAAKAIRFVLTQVYGYTEPTVFTCEVHDEGEVKSIGGDPKDLCQFASDLDGDLHLFPRNLDEPDYQNRWQVWVILKNGTRSKAPVCSPCMCVNDGVVRNPYGESGHREVAGWWVDDMGASEIEISIDGEPSIIMPHPRPF